MWILFALLSAWGWATSDAFAKKELELRGSVFLVLWVRYLLSLLFLLPFLFIYGIPRLDYTFFFVHIFWIPLEVTAAYLYMKAISISPLSLTLPVLSLTPLFILFSGRIILGERAAKSAILGIVLIVVGSYILHLRRGEGLLGPMRFWLKEKGSLLMVLVAFLYSFTSVFGKILIKHSSPQFFSIYYATIMTVILLPFALREVKVFTFKFSGYITLSGFFFAIMILFHMLSLNLAMVAYMISLKRLSGLIGVLYGGFFFKEKNIGFRLIGASLLVAGAILIGISKGG